jgi:hemoglobin-like flavoprotein
LFFKLAIIVDFARNINRVGDLSKFCVKVAQAHAQAHIVKDYMGLVLLIKD